ncbi:hypothetical protein Q7P37_006197 [Cladosporium fusiforme]
MDHHLFIARSLLRSLRLGRKQIPHFHPLVLTSLLHTQKKRSAPDETSWASAQHKPSLGNASFGHLVSELSSTKEGMEHLRIEGQTMSEEHRAEARVVVKWLVLAGAVVVGVPVGLGVRRMLSGGKEDDGDDGA